MQQIQNILDFLSSPEISPIVSKIALISDAIMVISLIVLWKPCKRHFVKKYKDYYGLNLSDLTKEQNEEINDIFNQKYIIFWVGLGLYASIIPFVSVYISMAKEALPYM